MAADDAQTWWSRAQQHYERQEWEQSRAAALKALELDPRLANAEVLLGLMATSESRFQEAERRFARAVALQPQNDRAQAYLASTYLQQKRFAEARRAFQKVLQLNPENTAAHYNLGLVGLSEQKPFEALPHFESVTRVNPSDVAAWIGLLESRLLLKRSEDARRAARTVEELLQPNDPRLFQAATLLALHQEYPAAIQMLEKIRRAFPQSYDVNYNLALAYFRTQQHDKAAAILSGFEDRAEARNLLASVEENRGRYQEAARAFQRAAELAPGNEDYRFDYANTLLQHQDAKSAVAAFLIAARDFPRSWRMRLGLGAAYYLVGNYEDAARVLLEAANIEPNSGVIYFLLGKAYESAASYQPKIAEGFKDYLAHNSNDAWACLHYGTILYLRATAERQAGFQAAKQYLNKALALDSGMAEAYVQLGIIAQAEGKQQQSVDYLAQAIRLNPQLASAHYRLGLAYQKLGEGEKARAELDLFRRLKSEDADRERRTIIEPLKRR
jgi:tetratricopeptide (TPR) repeat protein